MILQYVIFKDVSKQWCLLCCTGRKPSLLQHISYNSYFWELVVVYPQPVLWWSQATASKASAVLIGRKNLEV